MKYVKTAAAVLLIAAMVLSLAACSAGSTPEDSKDKQRLISLLDDIAENVKPGSAGNKLTAVRIAADLVSWAASTEMTKQEAAQVVAQWLKEQSPELRDAFVEKLSSVASAYGKIAADEAKELLEDANIQETVASVSGRLKELVEAILASGGITEG